MEDFGSILNEIIQKNNDSNKTVEFFAKEIGISNAQLSRIKSKKSTLSDNVINKIYVYFLQFDKIYANALKERLGKIKSEGKPTLEKNSNLIFAGNSAIDKYARLLENLSQENSLLLVDNRDFPVSLERFPHLDDLTIDAVNKGLSIAMFQPFGSRAGLIKKRNLLSAKSVDVSYDLYSSVDEIVNSYDYLIRLASSVSNLYWKFKNAIHSLEQKTGGKALGRIVLYEADYFLPMEGNSKSKDENEHFGALPSLVASGIMSKLFYAHFLDSTAYQTKIYEWVSAQNEELFFVERSNLTLNFNAVKMQFNPIPAYWKKYKEIPQTNDQLKKAYLEFGLETIFKEKEFVKWNICSTDSK